MKPSEALRCPLLEGCTCCKEHWEDYRGSRQNRSAQRKLEFMLTLELMARVSRSMKEAS